MPFLDQKYYVPIKRSKVFLGMADYRLKRHRVDIIDNSNSIFLLTKS